MTGMGNPGAAPLAIGALLDAYPRDLGFSPGDDLPIPLPPEERVPEFRIGRELPIRDLVRALRPWVDPDATCKLPSFSMRMAIHAVRDQRPQAPENSLFSRVADNDLSDWRDALRALSIVDDCSRRLSPDFDSLKREAAAAATERAGRPSSTAPCAANRSCAKWASWDGRPWARRAIFGISIRRNAEGGSDQPLRSRSLFRTIGPFGH